MAKRPWLQLGKMYRRQHGMDTISLMPTNLYGTSDNFDQEASHVLPALLAGAFEAKRTFAPTVQIWGSGNPRREFLHVDDLADAAIFALRNYDAAQHLNIGSGEDISIREPAELISEVVGWKGELIYAASKPDGNPRKLLEVSHLNALGWKPQISLREGLERTYHSMAAL